MLKKKSIIKEWGISYVLILLIPLISVFVNDYNNTKTIRKEIMQAHELILDNLKDNIDRLIGEAQDMYSFFYVSEEFRNLVYSQTLDARFYYDAQEFEEQLYTYGVNNNTSYWVYMRDKDYVLCSEGGNSSANMYNSQRFISKNMPEYGKWKTFLGDIYSNEFFFFDGLYSKKDEKCLVYANGYAYYGDGKTNIFITIPVSILEQLTDSLPPGSLLTIHIKDKKGDLDRGFLAIDSEGLTELPENVDAASVIEGGTEFEVVDYMGISAESVGGKFTYSLLVPQEIFWKESRYIRNVNLVSLFVTLLVGVGLVIFLLKRNFHPVSSLLQIIGSNDKEINEFQQIENAYNMMKQKNYTMKEIIRNEEPRLIGSYLLSLLKGRVSKIGEKEHEMGLNLPFRSGAFALIGLYVPQKDEIDIEYDELSFFIVDNIFTELMEKETFYRAEDGRFMFYLFCIPENSIKQWKDKSLKQTKFLCDYLDEKFGLSLSVAISEVETDISQAKYMYESVMEVFEYKWIIGGSGLILTEELRRWDEDKQSHVHHVMLVHALENGKQDEALRVSERLFCDTAHMPFTILRLRVLEAFQAIAESYNTYITDSVKRMQLLSWLDTLLNANDGEMLKEQFDGMLSFVCAKINGQWEAENKGIVKTIKEYVEANYTDNNLNISSLAEEMHRNPKYISKVFKEETGEGILDYINVMRIRKAQEIMLTRNISVEEVSAMVGYASVRTFRRSFAKIVGMTPGSYVLKN